MKSDERLTVLQIIRSHPYLTKKQIAEETGRSIRTVENKMNGIRQEILKGRYSPYVLPEGQGIVNWYVYVDFLTYEKMLADKNMRKAVPEFNPMEIEKISGFRTRVVDLEEDEFLVPKNEADTNVNNAGREKQKRAKDEYREMIDCILDDMSADELKKVYYLLMAFGANVLKNERK